MKKIKGHEYIYEVTWDREKKRHIQNISLVELSFKRKVFGSIGICDGKRTARFNLPEIGVISYQHEIKWFFIET